MSSHSCYIGKVSPQCGCRNGSSDYEQKYMSSHSCHIDKVSPQCGCRNVSSDHQLKCMSSHRCHIGKAFPLCGPSCVSWEYCLLQWSSHTGHRSSHQCSPSFYSATSLLWFVRWTGLPGIGLVVILIHHSYFQPEVYKKVSHKIIFGMGEVDWKWS